MTTDFTRESFTRPARNGDEVDAFAADHRAHGYHAGERAGVKARASLNAAGITAASPDRLDPEAEQIAREEHWDR
jgi:hypothetical protein